MGRLGGGGERRSLGLLPLASLMEHEDGRKDHQRGKEVDVVAILDLERRIPDEAERPLKDHNRAGDEADDERRVVLAYEAHDCSGRQDGVSAGHILASSVSAVTAAL